MLAPGATALMGMASPFTVLLAAVLGKEGRQPKLQCPTHTHTLKINMLQCLKYLAEAICRALRGRRGEELLHSAGVADAGRRRAGQRRWRARAGGMRQCGPSDGCWFRSPPCMPLSSPAAALPRRLCSACRLRRRLGTWAAAVSASRARVDPRMPHLRQIIFKCI